MAAIRIPTHEEYLAFDGGYSHNKWAALPEHWRCPACWRVKFELLRWTRRTPPAGVPFDGWMAAVNVHHDHGVDPYDHRTGERRTATAARFGETLICDQCNAADGRAKKLLGLPGYWSFCPIEIGDMVTSTPHARHVLDLELAREIYEDRSSPIDIFADPVR